MSGRGKGGKGLAAVHANISEHDAREILKSLLGAMRSKKIRVNDLFKETYRSWALVVKAIFDKFEEPYFDADRFRNAIEAINQELSTVGSTARIGRIDKKHIDHRIQKENVTIRQKYLRAIEDFKKSRVLANSIQETFARKTTHHQLGKPFRVQSSHPVLQSIFQMNADNVRDLVQMLAQRPRGRPQYFRMSPQFTHDMKKAGLKG